MEFYLYFQPIPMIHGGLMVTKCVPTAVWVSTSENKHVTEFHSSLPSSLKFRNTKMSWSSPLYKLAQMTAETRGSIPLPWDASLLSQTHPLKMLLHTSPLFWGKYREGRMWQSIGILNHSLTKIYTWPGLLSSFLF